MKITKGTAFLISMLLVFLMFLASSIVATVTWFKLPAEYHKTELLLPFIGTFLASTVSLAAGFFGFNVADNGVKGKFFNPGLTDKKE